MTVFADQIKGRTRHLLPLLCSCRDPVKPYDEEDEAFSVDPLHYGKQVTHVKLIGY